MSNSELKVKRPTTPNSIVKLMSRNKNADQDLINIHQTAIIMT
jgi:hypothetical protein